MAQEFVIPAEIPATFTRVSDADVVWVHHPETGNYAQLALGAVPFWTGRGWQVVDEPPPEVDPTRAHMANLPPAPEPEPEAEPEAGDEPAPTKSSRKRATTSATDTEDMAPES